MATAKMHVMWATQLGYAACGVKVSGTSLPHIIVGGGTEDYRTETLPRLYLHSQRDDACGRCKASYRSYLAGYVYTDDAELVSA